MKRKTPILVGTVVLAAAGLIVLYYCLNVSSVAIENASPKPLFVSVFVKHGYQTVPVVEGALSPHQTLSAHFIVQGDGELWVACRTDPNGAPISRGFDYVTSDISANYRFSIATCSDIKMNLTR